MKWLAPLLALGALLMAGCDSGGSGSDAAPKGEKPPVTTAPEGSKTPEQRGMENQNKGDQDGGGQDSK